MINNIDISVKLEWTHKPIFLFSLSQNLLSLSHKGETLHRGKIRIIFKENLSQQIYESRIHLSLFFAVSVVLLLCGECWRFKLILKEDGSTESIVVVLKSFASLFPFESAWSEDYANNSGVKMMT